MNPIAKHITKIENQISEKQARLDVVNDILSFETDPTYLRSYKASRTKLTHSISSLRGDINRIKRRAILIPVS